MHIKVYICENAVLENSILTDPRKFMGEISARYIGVSPALSPELIPMMKRPMMISSYDE